jgi:hypothetical protein
MGYEGQYARVKDAVRMRLRVNQEVFMPLVHRVGEAQVDFGCAPAKVSGETPWRIKRISWPKNRSFSSQLKPKNQFTLT